MEADGADQGFGVAGDRGHLNSRADLHSTCRFARREEGRLPLAPGVTAIPCSDL